MMKKSLLIACMFILIVSCAPVQTNHPTTQQTIEVSKIYIFDVGQGSAALSYGIGDGDASLIDTGNDPKIIEYLNRLGIHSLNLLILTHPDKDHIGMAQEILEKLDVNTVVWNGQVSNTKTFKELFKYIDTNNISLEVINVSSDQQWTVLNPQNTFYQDENDNSIVSFLSFGSIDVFIGGDCSEECEQNLILPHPAEIYIVDHHGSKSASTERMLEQLSPNLCIVSAGVNNQYGHPSDEALKRMKDAGCSVFDTMNGTLIIETDGNTYKMGKW